MGTGHDLVLFAISSESVNIVHPCFGYIRAVWSTPERGTVRERTAN